MFEVGNINWISTLDKPFLELSILPLKSSNLLHSLLLDSGLIGFADDRLIFIKRHLAGGFITGAPIDRSNVVVVVAILQVLYHVVDVLHYHGSFVQIAFVGNAILDLGENLRGNFEVLVVHQSLSDISRFILKHLNLKKYLPGE